MPADPSAAREQARAILEQDRFQEPDLPRPLERPLDWLGERLSGVGDFFDGLFDDVDASVPGGDWVVWVVLGVAVAVIAAAFSRSAIRRRAVSAVTRRRGPDGAPPPDPAVLEREADAAERAGDYAGAVRLRFRAGVLRLERADRTTGEIAAELGSSRFDTLGAEFDAVAYGDRPADAADANAAREGWAAVLEEARR